MCVLKTIAAWYASPLAADHCPYGITCRWASKHERPDALTQKYIHDKRSAAAAAAAAQDAAAQEQPGGAMAGGAGCDVEMAGAEAGGASTEAAAAPAASDAAQQVAAAPEAGQQWWRRDGTIPAGALDLPVGTEPPAEAINVLSKDLQQKLRWGARWRACLSCGLRSGRSPFGRVGPRLLRRAPE